MKNLWFLIVFIFVRPIFAQQSDFSHINFSKADGNALSCKNEKLNNLPQLVDKLTVGLPTEAERFRAIYLWVCTNISNDYSLFLKNERKRRRFEKDSLKLSHWNSQFNKTIFRELVNNKKTICTGYAYLVKKLANLANLNCEIIHGYGRTSTTNIDELITPNHSWIAVELNGKWYLCDPTWASGLQNASTFQFTFQYNDGYFLSEPELFAVNHFPIENKWFLLEGNTITFKAFLKAPVIYGKAYENLLAISSPKKMLQTILKNEKANFEFVLQKLIAQKEISLLIDNGHHIKKTKPTSTSIKGNSLTIEQLFNSNGFYDIHVYFGEDLISTFTVRVKS
jgi:transglutaminase/protease-like cytokinesis protein 3